MPSSDSISFDALEALVHRDPCRRGVASFLHQGRFLDAGQLEAAARHLAEHARSVAIVTGFAVRAEPRPIAETDGPPGALYLARALRAIGIEVTLISDAYGVPLLEAGCKLWGLPISMLTEFPGDPRLAADWIDSFLAGHGTLTHLISIERVGPSHTLDSLAAQYRDGQPPIEDFQRDVPPEDRDVCHNMRGLPLDDITAPTHLLFDTIAERRLPITTIGIGDGGNETGLGKFPWEVLRQAIASDVGGRIACRIATDFTLLAGVSNWAGYALAGAVCALFGRANLLTTWTAPAHRALIETLVRDAGAIDGLTLRREPTVDGLSLDDYLATYSQIQASCRSIPPLHPILASEGGDNPPAATGVQFLPCPCCGHKTITDTFDICSICDWEHDPVQESDPDSRIGANRLSLRLAQQRFLKHGGLRLPPAIPPRSGG